MNNVPPSVWRNPTHFLAFGFGSGAAPFAPGTFGTLAAIPIYLLLQDLSWYSYLLVVSVGFAWGVSLCGRTAADIGVHDHSGIVWDEFIGYLLTMFMAPTGWLWVVVGFLLFRVFDILKPWPINRLDREVHGGLGIMLDDVLAGIFACAGLHALVWAGHRFALL